MKKFVNGQYIEMSEEEIATIVAEREAAKDSPEFKMEQIQQLKVQLSETDYKAIKFAEGWMTEEEYAPVREERQTLRDQINALEAEL